MSINQIAPHITSSVVPGVTHVDALPSFSPYATRIKHDQSGGNNQQDNSRGQESAASASSKTKDESSAQPEIFKLVTGPSFADLFILSMGKSDRQFSHIIKTVRTDRGVTELVPLSNARQPSQKDVETYHKPGLYFSNPKGARFTGTI